MAFVFRARLGFGSSARCRSAIGRRGTLAHISLRAGDERLIKILLQQAIHSNFRSADVGKHSAAFVIPIKKHFRRRNVPRFAGEARRTEIRREHSSFMYECFSPKRRRANISRPSSSQRRNWYGFSLLSLADIPSRRFPCGNGSREVIALRQSQESLGHFFPTSFSRSARSCVGGAKR